MLLPLTAAALLLGRWLAAVADTAIAGGFHCAALRAEITTVARTRTAIRGIGRRGIRAGCAIFLARLGTKFWPLFGLRFRFALLLTGSGRLLATFGFDAFFADRTNFGHGTNFALLAWRRRRNSFTS